MASSKANALGFIDAPHSDAPYSRHLYGRVFDQPPQPTSRALGLTHWEVHDDMSPRAAQAGSGYAHAATAAWDLSAVDTRHRMRSLGRRAAAHAALLDNSSSSSAAEVAPGVVHRMTKDGLRFSPRQQRRRPQHHGAAAATADVSSSTSASSSTSDGSSAIHGPSIATPSFSRRMGNVRGMLDVSSDSSNTSSASADGHVRRTAHADHSDSDASSASSDDDSHASDSANERHLALGANAKRLLNMGRSGKGGVSLHAVAEQANDLSSVSSPSL